MTRGDRVLRAFASAPRYDSFYALFERAGANVEQATAMLAELIRRWPDDGARLRFELKELETHGDRIVHDVIQHLNVKAATPFAVSDAHELISELDDVVDLAEEVADFMGLYRIEAATEQAIALASVLEQAGRELTAALTRLRRPVDLRPHIVALTELEHEGDRLERGAISSLFEAAIDASHHVGNTLEGVIVKST
jgi:uncharacterized protein